MSLILCSRPNFYFYFFVTAMADSSTLIVALLVLFFILRTIFATPRIIPAQEVTSLIEMFPNISREAIVRDLQVTKSIDQTTENILNGLLATQPVPILNVKPMVLPVKKYIIEQQVEEPNKEWNELKDDRQMNLTLRKQFMIQQARKKFEAKQK
jgi:hypothetical protein